MVVSTGTKPDGAPRRLAGMPDRRWFSASAFGSSVLVAILIAACASTVTPSPTPASSATAVPTAPATPTPEASVGVAAVPTACLNLGPEDCQRAGEVAIAAVGDAAAPIIYVQVGPFGCADGQVDCPATLAARPEGDVTLELAGQPAIGIHIRVVDGVPSAERTEVFGVVLDPTAAAPLGPGPRPFELGHCGIFSGIDLGGSWWDPIGPIDSDHGDSINAAPGILTINDPDHAVFVSAGGLTVQLLRRDGPKHLPMCQ